jgi:hypothetical protein
MMKQKINLKTRRDILDWYISHNIIRLWGLLLAIMLLVFMGLIFYKKHINNNIYYLENEKKELLQNIKIKSNNSSNVTNYLNKSDLAIANKFWRNNDYLQKLPIVAKQLLKTHTDQIHVEKIVFSRQRILLKGTLADFNSLEKQIILWSEGLQPVAKLSQAEHKKNTFIVQYRLKDNE